MSGAFHPLILGSATGYQPAQIGMFVESLQRSGYQGTTALLVDRSNRVLLDYLTSNGVEVILLDSEPRWMPGWLAKRRQNSGRIRYLQAVFAGFDRLVPAPLKTSYAVRVMSVFHHISNSRYFHYLSFLQANAHRFSHALLTDVRDVLFQSDPFAGIPSRCLWLFQECDELTLGNQPTNRAWVEAAYGAEGLYRIENEGILCSGTTMGSIDLLIDYLRLMRRELVRITPVFHCFGIDQAVHNWLYWTGALPEAEIKQNFVGAVAALLLEPPERLKFDGEGRLLRRDGQPAPVVHQYDRFFAVDRDGRHFRPRSP